MELSSSTDDYNVILVSLLTKLKNARQIFKTLPLIRKTAFIQAVFGPSLWYESGIFRTPWVHPLFSHKVVELKEKGLLEIQQPTSFSGITPERSPTGNWFEHLTDLWRVVA